MLAFYGLLFLFEMRRRVVEIWESNKAIKLLHPHRTENAKLRATTHIHMSDGPCSGDALFPISISLNFGERKNSKIENERKMWNEINGAQ